VELDEALRERQARPVPSGARRRAAELLELAEEARQILRAMPTPVSATRTIR